MVSSSISSWSRSPRRDRVRDSRRVVITGLGIVAPCGTGPEEFWAGLQRPAEPVVQRRIPDFGPPGGGHARRGSPDGPLRAAGRGRPAQALADAGLDGDDGAYDDARCGVVLVTGIGAAYAWESQSRILLEKGPARVSPLVVPTVMPNAAAAMVSMRFGWRGPVETVVTACASGTHAVSNGAMPVPRKVNAGAGDDGLPFAG